MAALSAAVDGELEPGRGGQLDAHLAGCPACAAFRARLDALRQHLRFEPVGTVPDVAPQVLATLRATGAAPRAAVTRAFGRRVPDRGRSGRGRGHPPIADPAPVAVGPRWGSVAHRRSGVPADVHSGVPAAVHSPGGPGVAARVRRLLPVAAAFLCGVVAGATFIGLGRGGPGQVALADLPGRVVAAQQEVTSLAAEVSLVERGWHPSVPERRFGGRLRYRAPEELAVELTDRTAYPSAAWVPGDLALVVAGDRWWTRGRRACPVEALPQCTPRAPEVRLVERREPFDEATPVPLDLVTPVRSFTPAAAGTALGGRRVAGRDAVGVAATAAQAAPLLTGLVPVGWLQAAGAGNLRALHPADRVELWLDRAALVPLQVRVAAAPGEQRRRWADARGYRDRPGQVVLELTLSGLTLNRPLAAAAFPPPPAGTRPSDAAFRDAASPPDPFPEPAWLPPGFRPYRAGLAGGPPEPAVAVRTWTDGRAWVKVRATRGWRGGRLFGDLGELVRPAGLGAGVAYWSEDGRRVAVHGAGVDLVVLGSLGPADLARVAASLPVAGRPVPAGWAEAATSTLPEAAAVVPGLLRPRDPAGFAPPAVRVDGRTVTLAYAGPGARGFLLVQASGDRLAPPLDDDPVGVPVRGSVGRWSPARSELEWVEAGRTLALRSASLPLDELLAIAATLEPA